MSVRIIQGDVREELPKLPADYFDCIVTSPPYYGLRDYGCDAQIGLEPTLDAYLETMVTVCRELRRVLKPSGVCFINIGDSYAGSWGAQSRGVVPSFSSTLQGDGHIGGDQKLKNLSSIQIAAAARRGTHTGTIRDPGLKPKDLMLAPERLGIALQADGWWVRSHIIWAKPNPMPESVTDRPSNAHETVWMLTKSDRYFWDAEAVKEEADCHRPEGRQFGHNIAAASGSRTRSSGNERHDAPKWKDHSTRNIRNVWTIATHPFPGAHFATFPPALVERCIKAACPVGGHILDPFAGSGTVGLVADRLGRDCTLIDLNTSYIDMAVDRIRNDAPLFSEVAAE